MNKLDKLDKFDKFMGMLTRRETVSVLLLLTFLAAALINIFVSPQLYQRGLHEGDIALKDVYAPYDFTYSWGIDEESTKKAKLDAISIVPYYVRRDSVLEAEARNKIENFYDILDEETSRGASISDQIIAMKDQVGGDLSDSSIRALLEYPDKARLRRKTFRILEDTFLIGYMDNEGLKTVKAVDNEKVNVFDTETGSELLRSREELLDAGTVRTLIENSSEVQFAGDKKARQAVASLIGLYIAPNMIPDKEKTNEKKNEIVSSAEPAYYSWGVKKNELIIEKGSRLNDRHVAQMAQLRRLFRPGTTPAFFLGVLLLFLLLGGIAAIYLLLTQKASFLKNTKDLGIILINMAIMMLIADFVMRSAQSSYFIPLASMGMIITLLVGFNTAFLSVLLMSVFFAFISGGKVEVALVLLVGSSVGMFVVKGAGRRSRILWAGFLAGAAKCLAIACIGLINGMELDFYFKEGVWGIASGLFSGFVVMGLLPVFEYLFKVPTNISMLELSDLNHPVLKKLAMEAPGTYHHSIMVGNLAEAACDAIGANSLMARVGAYYHDIGKIPKSEYFSENEMGEGSRHSNLAPSMSALIIAKHVKEGVDIAKKHKLNNTIIDFITQHHGDSLIAYFYQKAMEKSPEGTVLKEENFRYPGPRPQTKESAIILLADAVEATSRSLDEPTPSRIRNLVKKIVNNKFIDGQLNECDLTLRDMHEIADSFVRVLMGTFHTRLEYPENGTNQTNGKEPNGDKDKPQKPKQKKKD